MAEDLREARSTSLPPAPVALRMVEGSDHPGELGHRLSAHGFDEGRMPTLRADRCSPQHEGADAHESNRQPPEIFSCRELRPHPYESAERGSADPEANHRWSRHTRSRPFRAQDHGSHRGHHVSPAAGMTARDQAEGSGAATLVPCVGAAPASSSRASRGALPVQGAAAPALSRNARRRRKRSRARPVARGRARRVVSAGPQLRTAGCST